jgi:hypothetical protein
LGEITHYGDGAAWAAAMVAVARCYDRLGEDGRRKTEDARRIAREVGVVNSLLPIASSLLR